MGLYFIRQTKAQRLLLKLPFLLNAWENTNTTEYAMGLISILKYRENPIQRYY